MIYIVEGLCMKRLFIEDSNHLLHANDSDVDRSDKSLIFRQSKYDQTYYENNRHFFFLYIYFYFMIYIFCEKLIKIV